MSSSGVVSTANNGGFTSIRTKVNNIFLHFLLYYLFGLCLQDGNVVGSKDLKLLQSSKFPYGFNHCCKLFCQKGKEKKEVIELSECSIIISGSFSKLGRLVIVHIHLHAYCPSI